MEELQQTAARRKDRLTVVGTVYHQPGDGSPTSTDLRFGRWLETEEQPYSRLMKSSTDWKLLDVGWLGDNYSTILLTNAGKEIIFIGVPHHTCIGSLWRILPGDTSKCDLIGIERFYQRSEHGESKLLITIYPN